MRLAIRASTPFPFFCIFVAAPIAHALDFEAWFEVDNQKRVNIEWDQHEQGGYSIEDYLYTTADYVIEIDAYSDAVARLSYEISALARSGSPLGITYCFNAPVSKSIDGGNQVSSALTGTLKDFAGDGVWLLPHEGPMVQQSWLGSPRTHLDLDTGPAFLRGGEVLNNLYGYGQYAAGPKAGPDGSWDALTIQSSFTLSGGGDQVLLSGETTVQPAPEASTLLLLGAGLLGSGQLFRRRQA